ncbi:transglycosylase SLT domain-containing protein [Roseomonas sp. BN140053]|uniref:transglycosylase SLT domain-containing protein n=1 Tax=Roseomonas sp. BN140053 TaxID=3391898 RepID=UPI0039E878DA
MAQAAPVPGSELPASALCLPAIAAAERSARLPAQILRSIALVESGRVDPATGRTIPWPWAVNVAGTGYFYASKDEAVTAVRQFQANGAQSIDVGCAQINLQHHPGAFATLDSAFDPQANASYAARFLNTLYATTGNWPLAAAGYHSRTAEIGLNYARKVMAIWPNARHYGGLPQERAERLGTLSADYSIFKPSFAAQLRRMDEDRAQREQGTAAPELVWVNRPPEPVRLLPTGTQRMAQREPRRVPG